MKSRGECSSHCVQFRFAEATIQMGRTGPACCIFIVQNNDFVWGHDMQQRYCVKYLTKGLYR